MDEQYTLAVLAHVSDAPGLSELLDVGGSLNRALERSPSIDDRLIEQMSVDESGNIFLTPEHDRLNKVFRKIALGLYMRQYARVPAFARIPSAQILPFHGPYGRDFAHPAIPVILGYHPRRWTVVQKDMFSYIFVRGKQGGLLCVMDVHRTCYVVVEVPHPSWIRRKLVVSPAVAQTMLGQLELF